MAFDNTFRHAIPGMSLTHKMGDLPHEKPPQFVDPNEALDHIWKMLNQKEALKQIWLCLEKGISVWHIKRALLYKLCLEGVIQLNLALVLGPMVGKMIEVIGRSKGIKPVLAPKFRDKTGDAMMNDTLNKKLGRTNNPMPIPPSALKSTVLPKPEEITQSVQNFTGKKPNHEGLLSPITKQQEQG